MAAEPLRILVRVSSKSEYYSKAWTACEDIIAIALDALKASMILDKSATLQPRLIAVDRYHIFSLIVFDIFHDAHDAGTGHLSSQTDLQVCQVFISTSTNRDSISAKRATEGVRRMVNEEIRKLHELNGKGAVLPFKADHLNGNAPVYIQSPQSLISEERRDGCGP